MTISQSVQVGNVLIGAGAPFALISGPCQIESRDHALFTAEKLVKIASNAGRGLIYKSSFDKANRTSVDTPRGIGRDAGLAILAEVRRTFGIPVVTDVHEPEQCAEAAEVVDLLQIPAFLSRQTDLLVAAGRTELPVNLKKGQFMAPWDVKNAAEKIASTGNRNVMLCDRGTSFGYNTLVTDFRGLPIMAESGFPIVFDATHSVQNPGGNGGTSGGDRRFVPPLARAAVAVGCDALFIESHEDPDRAPSDGPNMISFDDLPELLASLGRIEDAVRGGGRA
jgi:2-dehydro-3-deoxyphosphooctonate aldolase (KDO 8-P synthase)